MNTPAKSSALDFLMKTPIDTTREPKSQRNTSPLNNTHYLRSNFMNNMITRSTEQKNYQSFDNFHKQESHFSRPHNITNPVFAENRGFVPRTSAKEGNMMDFFQSTKSGAFSERIDFSPINNYRDQNNYDERFLGMRKGSSSEAYLNAIKSLQEKVGLLSEKVKLLESENGFLKNFQEEQRLERGREERQFQDSTLNILDKLENLGNENLTLKKENKDLLDNNQALGKENVKLTDEKKKLKKKVVNMKAEAKAHQEVVGELEKKLQKVQMTLEESSQKAKSVEEKLQEEVKSLKKEKEGLEFKVANLSELVKKQDHDLTQGKKVYNQHLEKLALANQALLHDNQQIKDHYSREISEFAAELEMIHHANAKKTSEYEEDIAELKKDNAKLAELLKMKNEDIQILKAKNKEEEMKSELKESLHTVRARLSAMRANQSPPRDKDDCDSPKLSSSVLTSFAREKTSHASQEKTPDDLYRQAKMLLATQGDETRQRNVRGGISSPESSPERTDLNFSKLTTRSNISRRQRYNRNEETSGSRSKTPTDNRVYWKEKDVSVSSNDDNSGYMAHGGELKSRAERKEAKYNAHAMRTSYRDYSPSLDQSAQESANTRSTLQGNRSGEKRGIMKSNYGTFGPDDKGTHQLFYSNEEGHGHKEVLESWRDNEQQKPKAQKSFFDVIQGSK